MHLEVLYLHDFRSYEKQTFVFSPLVNKIHGENAQGKTNLLEAIYLLSTGRSFRTPHLADLIRYGEKQFYLEASFSKEGLSQTLKISFDGSSRFLQYNETSYATFTPLLGLLPHVLYAPEDVALIVGAPAERRRFLDLHIAQSDPTYIFHLARYFKAMKQRNYLLRRQESASLSSWEALMAVSASYVIEKRKAALTALNPYIDTFMRELSDGQEELEIKYRSSFRETTPFCEQYEKERKREMEMGCTLIGPHRDELLFTLNKKEAKSFSSEGQKRCLIASLRLAQWKHLAQVCCLSPFMSIDDFGIHLDAKRQLFLHKQLTDLGQVFLTTPLNTEITNAHSLMISRRGANGQRMDKE